MKSLSASQGPEETQESHMVMIHSLQQQNLPLLISFLNNLIERKQHCTYISKACHKFWIPSICQQRRRRRAEIVFQFNHDPR